jgi:hypothetical protein
MIPPRMLSNENEIFGTGNGLKNRVTACRRRIRLNRLQRPPVNTVLGGRLFESANEPKVNSPLIHATIIHAPDRESLQPFAEPEVGIT